MASSTLSGSGRTQSRRDEYARENGRDKYGSPLEQLSKMLGMDGGTTKSPPRRSRNYKPPSDSSSKATSKPTQLVPPVTKPAPKVKSAMQAKDDGIMGTEKADRKASKKRSTTTPAKSKSQASKPSTSATKANYLAGGPGQGRGNDYGRTTSPMSSSKSDSDDLGYKIGKSLGDKRTKAQMVADRKAANEADRNNR